MPGSTTGALNPEPLEKGQASASLWKKACLWKKAPCPAGPKPLEKGSSCSWQGSLWKKAVAVAGRAAFGKRQ